jgi:hypothetical protein
VKTKKQQLICLLDVSEEPPIPESEAPTNTKKSSSAKCSAKSFPDKSDQIKDSHFIRAHTPSIPQNPGKLERIKRRAVVTMIAFESCSNANRTPSEGNTCAILKAHAKFLTSAHTSSAVRLDANTIFKQNK